MPRPHTDAPLMRLRIDGRIGNVHAIVPQSRQTCTSRTEEGWITLAVWLR
jgi:hypothetical protein